MVRTFNSQVDRKLGYHAIRTGWRRPRYRRTVWCLADFDCRGSAREAGQASLESRHLGKGTAAALVNRCNAKFVRSAWFQMHCSESTLKKRRFEVR